MAGVLDLPTLVQKVRMTSDTAGAERDVEAASKRIGSSMMKVGAGLTAGLTVPIVGLASSGVKAASDLAESSSKVGVVFEENAQKVKDFAATASTELGMSEQAALEAAGTFGNLFRALGIATAPAAEMSTALVTLAADLASFNNVDPEEALLALRSGLLGEAEPLRRFGVSLSAARIEAEAMATGLVKAQGDTTKITDATLKFEAAQKKLADAQSAGADPEKLNKASLAMASARDAEAKATIDLQAAEKAAAEARAKHGIGSSQATKAEDALAKKRIAAEAATRKAEDAQAKLGQVQSGGKADAEELAKLTNDVAKAEEALAKATEGTVPELTAAQKAQAAYSIIQKDTALAQGDFERTSDGLANQQRILAAQFTDAKAGLGQVFLPMVLKVTTGVNKLLGAFKGLSPQMKKWVGIAAGVAAAIGPVLIVVGQLVKSFTLVKAAIGAGSFALGLGPLLPVVVAIGAAAFIVYKNWDKVRPVLEDLAKKVVPVLVDVWEKVSEVFKNDVVPAVKDFAAAAVPVLRGVVQTIVKIGTTVVQVFIEKVLPVLQHFATVVQRWVGNVIDFFRTIAPQVKEAVGHVWKVIQVVFEAIVDLVQTGLGVLAALWRAWGDDLFNIVKAVFRTLGEVVRGALGVVKGIIQTVLAVINGDWGKAWDGLKAIVDGVWDAIFGVIRGAKDIVEALFGGIASTISEVWRGVWDGIEKVAMQGWKNLVRFVLNPMIEGFNKAIDGLNILNPFGDVKHIPLISTGDEKTGAGGGGPVRQMAGGGNFNPGDVTLTGERGPELQFRRFPGSVLSASRTEGLLKELVANGSTRVGGEVYRVEVTTVDRPSGERLGRDIAWGLTQARGRPIPAGRT